MNLILFCSHEANIVRQDYRFLNHALVLQLFTPLQELLGLLLPLLTPLLLPLPLTPGTSQAASKRLRRQTNTNVNINETLFRFFVLAIG